MSYTKDYSKMTDAEKFYAAITDARDYLGADRFDKIIAAMRDEQPEFAQIRKMLAFLAGVEGSPATAMYQYAFGFDADVSAPELVVTVVEQKVDFVTREIVTDTPCAGCGSMMFTPHTALCNHNSSAPYCSEKCFRADNF